MITCNTSILLKFVELILTYDYWVGNSIISCLNFLVPLGLNDFTLPAIAVSLLLKHMYALPLALSQDVGILVIKSHAIVAEHYSSGGLVADHLLDSAFFFRGLDCLLAGEGLSHLAKLIASV